MSRSINRVQLLGNLGKDVTIRFTPSGIQVAQFSVATSRRWKDKQSGEYKEETDWHRCVLWRCEHVASYLVKGKQVLIDGRLQTRSYDDRDGTKRYVTEVVIDDLILLGGGQDRQQQPAVAPSAGGAGAAPDAGPHGVTDEDVPF